MLERWQSLNNRERWLVGGGAVLVLFALLYVALLEPMAIKREQLAVRLAAEQAALSRIQENADKAIALRERRDTSATVNEDSGRSLLAVVNQTAAKHQLQSDIRRIVPNGADKATVAFDAVSFDDLIAWLTELQQQSGIVVSRINLDRDQQSGYVRANLSLAR